MLFRTAASRGRFFATWITLVGTSAVAAPVWAAEGEEAPGAPQGTESDTVADTETPGDDAATEGMEEPDPLDAPAEPVEEEAPVEAPGQPPPPPEKEKLDEAPPLIQPYGIIRPELITANGVETFGKTTMVAPTAAANPYSDPNYDEWALSFQLQQTRFGLKVGEGGDLSGRLEVDFVDPAFSQSSPIQGTRLRLRLAYFTYKPAEKHTLTIGQNWDIFSPLNALSMNMVGVSFMAGNSAFLRPQIIYAYGGKQGIEIAGAVGLRAQNTGPEMNLLEYGMVPTGALRVSYRTGKSWFGASAIVSAQMLAQDPAEYTSTFGFNLFGDIGITEWLSLVAEGYVGKNGNALGLLTLGSGAKVVDLGGYVSAQATFGKLHQVWATIGGAGVLNKDELALGYTPADAATGTPATRVGIGGIESNVNIRATYVLSPRKGLQFYLEPFLFLTRHKTDTTLDPTADPDLQSQAAFGTQLGSRYIF